MAGAARCRWCRLEQSPVRAIPLRADRADAADHRRAIRCCCQLLKAQPPAASNGPPPPPVIDGEINQVRMSLEAAAGKALALRQERCVRGVTADRPSTRAHAAPVASRGRH